ncbi:MAG: winged helix-turn-helix domain-containing protein [Methanobacterium formicicum]|jgi:predicted transcriptional regulator|uniref:Winged helix-turn-helix transcriptional regulator n=1 Tax=Methanobacterium formicicum TaxID=2162 RepID=A0A843AJ70_METFO|nr:winged helix-turn-helix domain-containing protein [Methanobacterium formicicum]MBF4475662.1 winged helix-turn-helix transcriptional regulator [Methanobacterium formicicum]MDD4810517.1 winged helix-turn-helix domain-containing protein [Methanobacterium formicicum]
MQKLLWWIIAGKRGGKNRARILKLISERPYNAHQISEELCLDYKTVRHHIKILEKNNLIQPTGDTYGKLYFLSSKMEENYEIFEEIWSKLNIK